MLERESRKEGKRKIEEEEEKGGEGAKAEE
jgi:hypothetical protein